MGVAGGGDIINLNENDEKMKQTLVQLIKGTSGIFFFIKKILAK